MILQGNITTPDACGYGRLEICGNKISAVEIQGDCRSRADWILPGFIDVHLHGIYYGDATVEQVHLMAEQAPQSGLTALCPAMASDSAENMLDFVKKVRSIVENPAAGSARMLGSHLEGPFLDYSHKGGMNENFLRQVDLQEIRNWLDVANGTLKIVTIAPELPNGLQATELLHRAGVRVSAGHTAMPPSLTADFVRCGGSCICHLFDTFDGRKVDNGVSVPNLADEVLVNDDLFIELITDGIHVPPTLVKLAIRCAGSCRIIGITDCMCGTGLPDGAYPMTDAGREFVLKNGDVCRLKDDPDIIVGSCLTQNQAFFNLTERFGFDSVTAARVLSTNPACYLGLGDSCGQLREGFTADITVLGSDKLTVRQTIIDGAEVYKA